MISKEFAICMLSRSLSITGMLENAGSLFSGVKTDKNEFRTFGNIMSAMMDLIIQPTLSEYPDLSIKVFGDDSDFVATEVWKNLDINSYNRNFRQMDVSQLDILECCSLITICEMCNWDAYNILSDAQYYGVTGIEYKNIDQSLRYIIKLIHNDISLQILNHHAVLKDLWIFKSTCDWIENARQGT